jgi:hypothetical protein
VALGAFRPGRRGGRGVDGRLVGGAADSPPRPSDIRLSQATRSGANRNFAAHWSVVSKLMASRAFVEVLSRRGERCQLRNPWGGRCLVQLASGASWEVAGDLLTFDTVPREKYPVSSVS